MAKVKTFYRIANTDSKQGLWYDYDGNFTGLIHDKFSFCKNSKLQMPYDKEVVGWLSATDTLADLFNWFSVDDILALEEYGYFITVYKAHEYKIHNNHFVINQLTSRASRCIPLNETNVFLQP